MSDIPEEPPKNFSRTPTSWDASDDLLLMHLKDNQKLGWKEIASHFQNRTPNACQFRWRRLKSGNLKNPPKSAAAMPALGGNAESQGTPEPDSRRQSVSSEPERKGGVKRRISELSAGLPSVYSPLSNTTFTGYESPSALTGMHTHMGPGAGIGSPLHTTHGTENYGQSPGGPGGSGTSVGGSGLSRSGSSAGLAPGVEVPLDPQAHSAAAGSSGGYFTDISVDPTSNLPHNRPHVVPNSQGMTPRNSATEQSLSLMHNNSIIQISRDERERDRTSVSSQSRLSVSSLPSKSMDIPHHHRNSLVHLPMLFGGSSISGPAGGGPSSVSGPSGIPHLASTLSSIRNGSIVGASHAYLRRSSLSTAYTPDKEEKPKDEGDRKDAGDASRKGKEKRPFAKSESVTPSRGTPTPSQPIFKIPWSMEEDELLINRRRKELSFAELSILLPQRTEGEIWSRIDALERLKNGHRTSVSRMRRRRQSSLGLDDDDDFYDDVDSVIDGMDSDDDEDDNDDVLLDVEDGLPGQRMLKKRRASSAVNPLSVREGIRGKLH